MTIHKILYIFIIFTFHFTHITAGNRMDVTIDINKNANNPRKKHFIVNKDIVSIGPPGFTEHIYEQIDPFNVTNFYFGRKKLEEGNKELTAKSVEKVGVFWKYETPVLLFVKHFDYGKSLFTYYRLTKHKFWAKVRLTAEQQRNLPLSGEDLSILLHDILLELGDIPEDKPIPGIGSFFNAPIILSLVLPIIHCVYLF